ncbi:ParA family protein [Dictyobacter arantiisoli]|uniref:Sporulation initiation inhibitor Soj n=1 Tax=Dictyobacter arantiisoli TaxID=2014874 RepID=A0A5A5THY6_9CHLR|nr:ParA family protein [Dictyobacter arantiisoli]GCF11200.1 sporulation initiation inhibitor Soj [Dictyobacter arantiisoli]
MKVYALTHIKGGVTKTTTTVNLSHALALLGYKVLVIDADPQSNSTFTLTGRMDEETTGTLYEALIPDRSKTIADLIKKTEQENLFVVEGSMWLYTGERELAMKSNREHLLKKAMRGLKGFDYVFIDTSPSLGLMTLNAWVASDGLIVPITLTTYGMLGIRILEYSLAKERRDLELDLPIIGVIGTLDDHTKNSKDMLLSIRNHFQELVFDTVLPRNIKVEEANNQAISLFEYAPQSTGAKADAALVKEILERVA